MKKINYILLFIITIFCFASNVFAIIDNSGGDPTDSGAVEGGGTWVSNYVGIRVSILNSNKQLETSKIILNKEGTGGYYFCNVNSPKTFNPTIENCWAKSVTTYKTTNILPENWLTIENGKQKNIDLHDILTSSNYEKLKKILELKGSNSKKIFNAGPGDYILIEPMIKIGNKYGTAFELKKSGIITTTNATNNYGSVFGTDESLMWKTLYLENNVPGIANKSTSDEASSISNRLDCLGDYDCGRGIGIFEYEDLYPKGYLKINKKRQGTTNHVWATAEFTVYKGSGCSGNVVESKSTSSGEVTFTLSPGSYSYKETKAPEKYIKDIACYNVSITSGSTVEKTVYNAPTCGLELEEAKKRVEPYLINILAANLTPYYSALAKELFVLYEKYPTYNGLLNITDPSCEVVSCKPTTSSFVSSCLSANTKNDEKTTFNKYNLSCYDTKLTNGVNTVGFCKNSLHLINNLAFIETSISDLWNKSGTRTFYSKSGSFLIRKIPWDEFPIIGELADKDDYGLIAYDYDKGKYVGELTPYIATATIEKTCYAFEGNNIDNEVKKLPTFNIYFGDNNDNGETEKLDYDVKTNNPINTVTESISDAIRGVLNSLGISYYSIVEKSYTEVRNYKLNKVYVEKISGKISTNPDEFDYFNEEVGIVTKFEDETAIELKKDGKLYKQGIIPFSVKYDGKTYGSDSCKYISEQEFIKNDKLNVEFRLIDTNNPFNRETNTNWCAFEGDIVESCKNNNAKVILYIKNRVNSYGRIPLDVTNKQQDPLYKITLTPSDIKAIREYNKDNKYDYYNLYCDTSNTCTNSFVYSLKNGILEQYEDNSPVKNYGSINKLIVKGS